MPCGPRRRRRLQSLRGRRRSGIANGIASGKTSGERYVGCAKSNRTVRFCWRILRVQRPVTDSEHKQSGALHCMMTRLGVWQVWMTQCNCTCLSRLDHHLPKAVRALRLLQPISCNLGYSMRRYLTTCRAVEPK